MNELVVKSQTPGTELDLASNYYTEQFVTVIIADQLLGLSVLNVHDILGPQKIASIPLSRNEIAGSLNLRGKIVTAVDVRQCMGLEPADINEQMHVVVEHLGDQYSLTVDSVGEVLNLHPKDHEANPPTMDSRWRDVSMGIYQLPERLMVVLDVDKLIGSIGEIKAA